MIAVPDARRVVHVFGVMDRGGAELRTVEVVERLERRGIDTTYVTLTGRPGVLADRIRRSGDRVVPIRLGIRFPVRFLRLLRAEDVDVVHSHVATFSGAMLALARMAGVRRRIAHFRSDGDDHLDTPVRRARRTVMKILIDLAATDIIGVSPGALDHGWRPSWRSDPRCRVIANGIDTAAVPPIEDRQAVRATLGIGSDARVVCHVGRSAPVKNRARAVELAGHPGVSEMVVLLVGSVGDGEAQHWRERGGKALRVLGERTDVLRLLNAADLTLVTSTREGLPGVVLESLAVGTPVVASDLPGVRWIAESVPGIEIRHLAEPNATWAASIVAGVTAPDRPARRVRLRTSFAGSRFVLETVTRELDALWGGSGTEETCE